MKTLKQLCEEWDTCDSISLKDDLEVEILEKVSDFYKNLVEIHDEVGDKQKFQRFDGYYRPDSGHFSLYEFYPTHLNIRYTDTWAYGGQCNESDILTFEEYENFDSKKIGKSIINENVKRIKREIRQAENKVKELTKSLAKYEESVKS